MNDDGTLTREELLDLVDEYANKWAVARRELAQADHILSSAIDALGRLRLLVVTSAPDIADEANEIVRFTQLAAAAWDPTSWSPEDEDESDD